MGRTRQSQPGHCFILCSDQRAEWWPLECGQRVHAPDASKHEAEADTGYCGGRRLLRRRLGSGGAAAAGGAMVCAIVTVGAAVGGGGLGVGVGLVGRPAWVRGWVVGKGGRRCGEEGMWGVLCGGRWEVGQGAGGERKRGGGLM